MQIRSLLPLISSISESNGCLLVKATNACSLSNGNLGVAMVTPRGTPTVLDKPVFAHMRMIVTVMVVTCLFMNSVLIVVVVMTMAMAVVDDIIIDMVLIDYFSSITDDCYS